MKKTVFIIIIALLAIFLIVNGYVVQKFLAAFNQTTKGTAEIINVKNALQEKNFSALQTSIKSADNHFQKAENILQTTQKFEFLPLVGKNLAAFRSFVTSATNFCQASSEIYQKLDFILPYFTQNKSLNDLKKPDREKILAGLAEQGPQLKDAQKKLKTASAELNNIPKSGVLPQITKAKNNFNPYLASFDRLVSDLVEGADVLPKALGLYNNQKYLLLFQNNAELRPSGGLIGSYAITNIDKGEFGKFDTADSLSLEKPPYNLGPDAPLDLAKDWYEGAEKLQFKDAGWSADFPTSAQKAKELYEIAKGSGNFNGIIAINPDLIVDLLGITGPVKIADYPEPFNQENLKEQLQGYVESEYKNFQKSRSQRKDILDDLADAILDKLWSLPLKDWGKVLTVINKNLTNKHLILYSTDSGIEKKIIAYGWAGEVKKTDGDYLMIVDANKGSYKINLFIKQDIDYQVSISGSSAIGKLKIKYVHQGASGKFWNSAYRSYSRIYLPSGTELIKAEGAEVKKAPDELGKTVLAYDLMIDPQKDKTIEVSYRLPENILKSLKNKTYSLLIQKQPGTADFPLTVKIVPLNENFKTILDKDKKF